jgi:hypothetical protein
LFNERFDPRSAKHAISRVGGFGTLGGLAGGLLANQVAGSAGLVAMLPVLAALHLLCAIPLRSLARETRALAPAGKEAPPLLAGLQYLVRRPYLRDLGLLMLLAATSAALLDFVFRHYATSAYSGDQLIHVFSWFHSAVALLTFLVQISLTRLLDRVQVSQTVAMLPAAVAASCLGVLAIPGLVSSGVARGIEMVMSNSIFRLGYELLYTPVAPNEKRSTKALIDVAAGRAGDAMGGGLTLLVLALATRHQNTVLLIGAALLATLALGIALRLNRGYVRALEWSLRNHPASLEAPARSDMSQGLDVTMLPISIARLAERGERSGAVDPERGARVDLPGAWDRQKAGEHAAPSGAPGLERSAEAIERERDLHSGEPARVLRALADPRPLPLELVPGLIPLLADDDLAPEVTRALRRAGPQALDPLVTALLDPERPAEVRRRIPRILSACPDERAVQGLLAGLDDVRFRVRLQCGWALARLHEVSPEVPIDRQRVLAAVLREVEIEKNVWGGRREMERIEDPGDSPFVEDYVRERASSSLQHIFTLLSAALSEQALLRLAFNGLHADPHRRGTALECLDYVLPPAVKEALWPFLEERGRPPRPTRTREEIIADLTATSESMQIDIAELRRQHERESLP